MVEFLDERNADAIREAEDLRAAFSELLGSAAGRRVLMWVLDVSGIYGDAYQGNDAATNYVLGQKSMGLRVLDKINNVGPHAYPRMLLARADDIAMNNAALGKEDDDEAV